MKKWNPKIDNYLLCLLLVINSIGFLYFEKFLIFKILLVILLVCIIGWQMAVPSSSAAVYLSYFLTIWLLLNLYFTVNFPLASQIFFLAIVLLGAGHAWFFRHQPFFLVYLPLFFLIFCEIYLVLSFWPIDPIAKSMIELLVFYLFWEIIDLKQKNQTTQFWQPIVVTVIIFILTIATTSWYTV